MRDSPAETTLEPSLSSTMGSCSSLRRSARRWLTGSLVSESTGPRGLTLLDAIEPAESRNAHQPDWSLAPTGSSNCAGRAMRAWATTEPSA